MSEGGSDMRVEGGVGVGRSGRNGVQGGLIFAGGGEMGGGGGGTWGGEKDLDGGGGEDVRGGRWRSRTVYLSYAGEV